jgi:DNA-binding helix-hairpin-helix protein with protein kinase domain
MRVRQPETSQEFELDAAPLGTGGEANVYAIPGQARIVAKVYHKPTAEHADKLTAMLAAPPDDPMAKAGHASIAWPTARLLKEPERFAGFLMPPPSAPCTIAAMSSATSAAPTCSSPPRRWSR